MSEYKLHGLNYSDVLKRIYEYFTSLASYIEVNVAESIGYRLFEDVIADRHLPEKDVAFYDGYAVRHSDIESASQSNPIELKVIASIFKSGDEKDIIIDKGEAVYVSANAPIPKGADTILRRELVKIQSGKIIVRKRVDKGRDIVKKGDDIKEGEVILEKGKYIEGQDITLLTEIGKTRVKVFRKPNVAIFSVGDELIERLNYGSVYPDNYNFVISYVVEEMGGAPSYLGILRDDHEDIIENVSNAVKHYDIVLLIGGASIGLNDKTGPALSLIGEPLFHGTTLSPGKVSGLYVVKDKPVFLVPGHVGSAISCLYYVFYPYIKHVYYEGIDTLPHIKGVLIDKPDQRKGKHTVRTVSIRYAGGRYYVTPYKRRLGGSTLISLLTRGAGLILLEPDRVYDKGDELTVRLFSKASIYKLYGE